MFDDSNRLRDDPLLSQKQIIAYLGISRTQFWRIRRTGAFPRAIHITQGIDRWHRSQLAQFISSKVSA